MRVNKLEFDFKRLLTFWPWFVAVLFKNRGNQLCCLGFFQITAKLGIRHRLIALPFFGGGEVGSVIITVLWTFIASHAQNGSAFHVSTFENVQSKSVGIKIKVCPSFSFLSSSPTSAAIKLAPNYVNKSWRNRHGDIGKMVMVKCTLLWAVLITVSEKRGRIGSEMDSQGDTLSNRFLSFSVESHFSIDRANTAVQFAYPSYCLVLFKFEWSQCSLLVQKSTRKLEKMQKKLLATQCPCIQFKKHWQCDNLTSSSKNKKFKNLSMQTKPIQFLKIKRAPIKVNKTKLQKNVCIWIGKNVAATAD